MDDYGMTFVYALAGLVPLIIILIINNYIASQFQEVAEKKGYTETKYKWICFFFGIAGMLLVVALPDLKLRQSVSEKTIPKKAVNNDELPDL